MNMEFILTCMLINISMRTDLVRAGSFAGDVDAILLRKAVVPGSPETLCVREHNFAAAWKAFLTSEAKRFMDPIWAAANGAALDMSEGEAPIQLGRRPMDRDGH
jgi:hypothetical protein